MRRSPNVIILTSGLTGSSVLTGLISRAGHWTGETQKKEDYDTYENKELIELNGRLLKQSGYTGSYQLEFSPAAIDRVAALWGVLDDRPYRLFLDQCGQHQPWIWKDPRLWLTIRYWGRLLDLEHCRFIVLTRGFMSCWISSVLRRQIRSYWDSRNYEQGVRDSALKFLRENGLPYLHVCYEDLIVHPAEAVQGINEFLGTHLTIDDLKSIYHKPLYKRPRSSAVDLVKAVLIYLKNYSERADLGRRRTAGAGERQAN